MDINEKITDIYNKHISSSAPDTYTSDNKVYLSNIGYYKNCFKDSIFECSSRKLVHFTKLEHLLSMINDKSIRLYNMQNSNDDKELTYSVDSYFRLRNIKFDSLKDAMKIYKENTFIFSTVDSSIDTNTASLLYEEYGRVRIEFELLSNQTEWNDYYLSKIHYGIPDEIVKFAKAIDNLAHDYKQYHLETILPMIPLSCIKENSWKEENEVRLFTTFYQLDKSFDKFDQYNSKHKRLVKYINLNLCNNEGEFTKADINYGTPKLKISKISFDQTLINELSFHELCIKISELLFVNFNYMMYLNEKNELISRPTAGILPN